MKKIPNNRYLSIFRYLIKTFIYAFGFAKPDVVVFLGDLLDEGSTSTDDEYKTYIKRFFRIFFRGSFDSTKVSHFLFLNFSAFLDYICKSLILTRFQVKNI